MYFILNEIWVIKYIYNMIPHDIGYRVGSINGMMCI